MFFIACLEEYKSIRGESREASINMIRSLSIGIGSAAIAVIASFNFFNGVNFLTGYNLIIILSIFCIIMPFLLALITAFWLGELARFKRAGNYICFIEAKVSMLLDDYYNNKIKNKWEKIQNIIERDLNVTNTLSELGRPIQWEIWLRSPEEKFVSDSFYEKIKQFIKQLFSTSGHMKWIYLTRLALLVVSFTIALFVGFKLVINSYTQISLLTFYLFVIWMIIIGGAYFVFVIKISRKLGIKQGPIILSKIFSETEKKENKSNSN